MPAFTKTHMCTHTHHYTLPHRHTYKGKTHAECRAEHALTDITHDHSFTITVTLTTTTTIINVIITLVVSLPILTRNLELLVPWSTAPTSSVLSADMVAALTSSFARASDGEAT